jgi:Flp pilus assembly pilin Flp
MRREEGITLTEYALVLGIVVLGALMSVRALGVRVEEIWNAALAIWRAALP